MAKIVTVLPAARLLDQPECPIQWHKQVYLDVRYYDTCGFGHAPLSSRSS
jgi:hypothetical protein